MTSRQPLYAELFREEGFIRKKCRRCGAYFWTLDPDREFCGDQPCVDYTFLGRPPTARKGLSLREVRESFLRFMERRGHTRIRRYPVVARWRDDVFLVGASIYDFQPWVTEGVIPPPANPLTISQPCIRLTDVDNVGRSGRHLTEFEMMAHHAFNYPGKEVYWIDNTVRLAYDFFTKELGVPPEKIVFKEDWWSGGGNAGEDFEVLIEGLEVATLVFMHYKVVDGQLIEMKNSIVDTGYGLERIVWLTHGTPTLYDAVFQGFIKRVRAEAGVPKVSSELLMNISRIAGKFDVKRIGLRKFREYVAHTVGIEISELERLITPLENIYILADHTRALAFMLGDGVVPSNVGAGYLARLIIRRALRALMNLGLEIPLSELVDYQLELLKEDYPELVEARDIVLEMVDLEEERFRNTLRRGRALVERRMRKLLDQGIKEVPTDLLIEFYDSHGLDPLIVKEVGEEIGIRVRIPEDFYTLLAERHQQAGPKVKEEKYPIKVDLLEGLPPTKELFYEDPYKAEFKAKVLKIIGHRFVVLDATYFYPEGGGQPADTGYLITPQGHKLRVKDVQRIGRVVVHVLDSVEGLKEGDIVIGRIDWERRLALMRNHTATHILLGAARRVLGPHVWQAGASKGVKRSHIDITHFRRLAPEELRKIELLANRVVCENRPVKTFFMDRDKAEAKYGFILYQGGVVPGKEIRVVEIEGWDVEACGGTHCLHTGEIGLIKILRAERIQDGVVRIEFSVAEEALRHVHAREEILQKISELTDTPVDELVKAVKKLRDRVKELRGELERLREERVQIIADKLLSEALELKDLRIVIKRIQESKEEAIKVAERITSKSANAVVVLAGTERQAAFIVVKIGKVAHRLGLSAIEIAKEASKVLGGGGGGTELFAQGGGRRIDKIEEALSRAFSIISGKLGS